MKPEIAVFGCGGWGKNLVRSLRELGGLRAVVDPTEAGRARAATLAPDVPVHASGDAVWSDPAVRGVMIATPAETHYELAIQALAAGKDVFVEKPLTIDVGEARDLVTRASQMRRVLMVGHLLEYHPAILALRDLVTSGELGKIRYIISNRLNLGKIRTEENALWSFAPHDIAVILRLVGAMPVQVVATGGSYVSPNIADVTVTQLLFDNGVRSHIFVSWLHPFKEQKLVVVGSKKMASFDDVSKELVLYDQRVDWQEGQPVPVRGEGTPVPFAADEPLKAECRHFIECVQTGCTPRTDGMNGLRVLQILHAAQRSLATNGQPAQLDAAVFANGSPAAEPVIETTVRPANVAGIPSETVDSA
ncbi:MAG: Gfo/Idh/MocA family oxidoreductase [Phycisphaerales bacterium]|nr:Gfo/Idh/MocA family oxidoreductase [Phycisphaerae bacterium]NNF42670.1 Gfo/Idh/MocA family oxidoreductase [Phycisphaerales bacterium]NNM24483.1 Gfo/Idh/MocA family oxidoreductase [Phycisphaerales bacterium]